MKTKALVLRNLFVAWLLPAILLFQTIPSLAQTVCSAPEVKLSNNYIQVAPNGVDDTENIQCTLDLAVEQRIPEIRLTRGDFFIGAIQVRGFAGTLQGGGRGHTRITLLDQAIECGEGSSAITFVGGEPRIRWLTLVWPPAAQPCIGSQGWLGSLLHFTGAVDDPASCSNDLSYATVDRVELYGPLPGDEPASFTTGVAARPVQSMSEDCSNLLLGTFRLNRSLLSGFGTGANVSMHGGAQVFIFQNVLENNHRGLAVDFSEAIVNITGNHLASVPYNRFSSCQENAVGVYARTGADSPGVRRLDLSGNSFVVSDLGSGCQGLGVLMDQEPLSRDNSVVVSDNRFELSSGINGGGVVGIRARGVSEVVVNSNAFHQQSQNDLSIVVDSYDGLFGGWSIVRNGFIGNFDWADIILGESCCCSLVGPGQQANVVDNGSDNTVLEPQ